MDRMHPARLHPQPILRDASLHDAPQDEQSFVVDDVSGLNLGEFFSD